LSRTKITNGKAGFILNWTILLRVVEAEKTYLGSKNSCPLANLLVNEQ